MIQYRYDKLTLTASSYNNRKLSIELPMDSNNTEVFDVFKALTQYFYEQGLDKTDSVIYPASEEM